MIHRMLSVMYLEWDIEWESSMAVASFTVLLIGFILGGSTVYLVENHLRTNETTIEAIVPLRLRPRAKGIVQYEQK